MRKNRLAFLLVRYSLVLQCLFAWAALPSIYGYTQSPASPLQPASQNEEIWCGWIESESEHLRWVVKKPIAAPEGSAALGTVSILDRSSDLMPISQWKIDKEVWSFQWSAPNANNQVLSFAGLVAEPNRVIGSLNIGNQLIPSFLQKVQSIPSETPATLGADIVWTDDSPTIPRSNSTPNFDFRFRFYTNPPFSDGKPRILFDSLKNGIVGQPATMSVKESPILEFNIPGIELVYRATLNSDGDLMTGTLTRNGERQAVAMKRIHSTPGASPLVKVDDTKDRSTPSNNKPKSNAEKSPDAVRIKMEENAKQPSVALADNERELTIVVSPPNTSKQTKDPLAPQNQMSKLVGTLSLPKAVSASASKSPPDNQNRAPVVILVSDFGLQDRDGTMGNLKPYRAWANMLSESGIASFRFDDHGVGASSLASSSFTIQDLAKELATVIAVIRQQPDIDPNRVGILGHGEGAIAATIAASTDPSIACIALVAPTGVKGGELLLAQGVRLAELEKMKPRERALLASLQKNLQSLSRAEYSDAVQRKRTVRQMLSQSWSELVATLEEKKTEEELNEMREAMVEQLDSELVELMSPWNKFFLEFDPTSQWMLVRSPTLAIWGENDTQVAPALNRGPIEQSATRNSRLPTSWHVVPKLNHWLQESPTGHPSEYESLSEKMAPNAETVVLQWFRSHL